MARNRKPVPCLTCDGTGYVTTTVRSRRTGRTHQQEGVCLTCMGGTA